MLNEAQKKVIKETEKPMMVISSAGSGKCVLGDTKILTNKGIIKIKDIPKIFKVEDEEVEDLVLSSYDLKGNKNKKNASHFFNMGKEKTIKITTSQGYIIEGTYTHRIIVINSNGDMEFKKLSEITNNDLICISKGDNLWGKEEYISENLAYAMGVFLGDGHFDKKSIVLTNPNINIVNDYKQILKKEFNLEEDRIKIKKYKRNCYTVRLSSVEVFRKINELGFEKKNAGEKIIPYNIMRCNKKILVNLLRGLFDTDGSCSRNKSIEYCSKSKELVEQIHCILLNLGIISRIKPRIIKAYPNNIYYYLYISGTNAEIFEKEVGFKNELNKKNNLQKILERKRNDNIKVLYNQIERINRIKEFIKNLPCLRGRDIIDYDNKRICFSDYYTGRRNLTYPQWKRISKTIKEKNEDILYLDNLCNNIFIDKIKTTEKSEGIVYDFCVPELHSFVGNGFINHNSSSITNKITKLLMEGKSNIIAITFTKNTRIDLQRKIFKLKIKDDRGRLIDIKQRVKVETFHSLCRRLMLTEGLKADNLVIPYEVENVLKKVKPKDDLDLKDILGFIGYQKNYMRSCEDEFVEKDSNYFIDELRDFYRAYNNYQKENERYDFDDYLLEGYKILQVTKDKYICDYLLLDEAQDCNEVQMKIVDLLCPSHRVTIVGDAQQCLLPDTKIKTNLGEKAIKDITHDDKVIVGNGRGNTTESNIEQISIKHYEGNIYCIKTKSGKEIKCTPNHMIFASKLINSPYYVYLMYRPEYGFRIGKSSFLSYNEGNSANGMQNRLRDEKGERLWCLKTCKDLNEALYYEGYYSFKYGIPQYVFEVKRHNTLSLTPEQVKQLYLETDSYNKGMKLLNDMDMYFEYPHCTLKGCSKNIRVNVNLTMFGNHVANTGHLGGYKGYLHEFNVCTTDYEFTKMVEDNNFDVRVTYRHKKNRTEYYEIRRTTKDYDKLYAMGQEFTNLSDGVHFYVKGIITKEKDKKELYPASNIRKGMTIGIYKDGELINDEVIEVEKEHYEGDVYDINISNYRNYIANDICVHNCIYGFRGSNPELFMNVYQRYEDTEVINMNINYRSDKEIVERSNYFIKQYYGSYEYYMDAVANSTENGNIEFIKNSTDTDEALEVADKIQTLLGLGTKGKDIAILYRNNIQSQALEGELRKRGIHYYIDSDASFFNRKEIDMIMCILRLIKDNNDNSAYEKIFKYKCLPLNMLKNDLLSSISAISKNENKNFLESSIEIRTDSWRKNKLRNFHSYIKRLSAKYISGVTLDVLLNDIITLFSLEEYIKGQHSNDEDKVEKIKSIENLKKIAKGQTLEQLLKLAYEGGTVKKNPSDEDIRLMTMHKSKGLEFKNVIIIGVEQGKFPSEKSEEKEEARLFYVAITRAKNNMVISQIGEYNKFIEQYFGKTNYAKRLEECV